MTQEKINIGDIIEMYMGDDCNSIIGIVVKIHHECGDYFQWRVLAFSGKYKTHHMSFYDNVKSGRIPEYQWSYIQTKIKYNSFVRKIA